MLYLSVIYVAIYQLLAAPFRHISSHTFSHLFAAHSQLSVNIPLMPWQAAIAKYTWPYYGCN